MQSAYAETFERVMTCTVADWLRLLPPAIGDNTFTVASAGREGAVAIELRDRGGSSINQGRLRIVWRVVAPRRVALICLPQLSASFSFINADDSQRLAFMRRFDLFMQRGGG